MEYIGLCKICGKLTFRTGQTKRRCHLGEYVSCRVCVCGLGIGAQMCGRYITVIDEHKHRCGVTVFKANVSPERLAEVVRHFEAHPIPNRISLNDVVERTSSSSSPSLRQAPQVASQRVMPDYHRPLSPPPNYDDIFTASYIAGPSSRQHRDQRPTRAQRSHDEVLLRGEDGEPPIRRRRLLVDGEEDIFQDLPNLQPPSPPPTLVVSSRPIPPPVLLPQVAPPSRPAATAVSSTTPLLSIAAAAPVPGPSTEERPSPLSASLSLIMDWLCEQEEADELAMSGVGAIGQGPASEVRLVGEEERGHEAPSVPSGRSDREHPSITSSPTVPAVASSVGESDPMLPVPATPSPAPGIVPVQQSVEVPPSSSLSQLQQQQHDGAEEEALMAQLYCHNTQLSMVLVWLVNRLTVSMLVVVNLAATIIQSQQEQQQQQHHVCELCQHVEAGVGELLNHSAGHTTPHTILRTEDYTFRLHRSSQRGMFREYSTSVPPTALVFDPMLWLNEHRRVIGAPLFIALNRRFIVKANCVLVCQYRRTFAAASIAAAAAANNDDEDQQQQRNEAARPEPVIYFWSPGQTYTSDYAGWWALHIGRILSQMDSFHERGSGMEFDRILSFTYRVTICTVEGRGQGFIPTPISIHGKRAVINVETDTRCFEYAVLAGLHNSEVTNNTHRPSSYNRWLGELVMPAGLLGGHLNQHQQQQQQQHRRAIPFGSMLLTDVGKFECANNVKVNVHLYDRGLKGPIYCSRETQRPRVVNLLLLRDVQNTSEGHFCTITRLGALYRGQPGHQHRGHQFTCDRCCRTFAVREVFNTHRDWCLLGKPQIEVMPKVREFGYKPCGYELRPLRIMYADIECYIDNDDDKTHLPAAVACRPVWHRHYNNRNERQDIVTWVGDRCVGDFLDYLEQEVRRQYTELDHLTRRGIRMRPEDNVAFNDATECNQCHRSFYGPTAVKGKVRDHCHLSGAYRQALCSKCNFLLQQKRRKLVVVFHNFKNYDSHMLLKRGIAVKSDWDLSCVVQRKERLMSLQAKIPVGQAPQQQQQQPSHLSSQPRTVYFTVQFIDSYQFLTSSLAKLAGNLESWPITESGMLWKYPRADMQLLRRKGVFPYSYFDSLARMQEEHLPPIEAFTNDLDGGRPCSQTDYAHAQDAWDKLDCRTFGEYMLRYLELDVNLLADVFERFREVTVAEDGLDPCWFITLPSISYTSAFRFTRETIHLLQDAEMYTMFERGIRGGLTFTNKHYARASTAPAVDVNATGSSSSGGGQVDNGATQRTDEEEGVDTVLAYVDENNLYGSALCQYLPHSNFEWVGESGHVDDVNDNNNNTAQPPPPPPLINCSPHHQPVHDLEWLNSEANILSLTPEAEYGYVLEVDLHYPASIHDLTADYPLAAEQGEVGSDQFSVFMAEHYKRINDTNNLSAFRPVRKLLLTQTDKAAYVVHYRILQFYLQMGMRLVRVRRAIRFIQKPFLRSYIEYNSRKRQEARNAFEKDFYKLKNNSLFGKTMEDVRKRINYLLKVRPEEIAKAVNSPLFHDRDIITEELVGLHMLKPKVVLNKPIYIGQAVLDFSKLEMYTLYYGTIKAPGPLLADVRLLAGDTDSFFLELKVRRTINTTLSARDRVFQLWKDKLDSSNYPTDHPLYSANNKARLLCFKDETGGREIEEMVCLRPKMYSVKFRDSPSSSTNSSVGAIKRAKGIGRAQVEGLSHADYRAAYESAVTTTTYMTILRSVNHRVQTVTIKKRALSAWDDKRFWISANYSLPFGHYRTVASAPRRPGTTIVDTDDNNDNGE